MQIANRRILQLLGLLLAQFNRTLDNAPSFVVVFRINGGRLMNARGVWFGNESWPSGASPGAFARDVFRLEACRTDKERALAFNKWLLRCMNRGPNLKLPGLGGYIHSADPLALFTSWGHNECTGWGWVAAEALQAAGMKARRAVAFKSGHTFYEVWYAGEDGKEGWHAFDPFIGWHFLNEHGEVASCEELAANPDLVLHPRGGSARLGHHPERSGFLHRYQVHDLLDVVQPVRNEELHYNPVAGQTFSLLWRPELPELAWRDDATQDPNSPTPSLERAIGAHCDISLYDEEGKPRYPEHHAYWKNYVWGTERGDGINGSQPVRWHGCGALRWQPLLLGESAAWRSANAVFENGTVRPSGARKHCEVWWHISLPYLATYLRLHPAVDLGGGDLLGFAVSPDAGRSLHSFYYNWRTPGATPKLISLLPGDAPSIRGLREFWLRLDMSTQSNDSPLRMRGLQLTVGCQVNMNVLPRLVPGKNTLFLQADEMDGVKLQAEWAYTHPDGEKTEVVNLDASGRATRNVDPAVKRPDELIMRGVTLRCEKAVGSRQ
jgi:hypothetical protein